MSQIIVIISAQGHPTITTMKFSGEACQIATAELEIALGAKVHERLTNEFYATNQSTVLTQHQ